MIGLEELYLANLIVKRGLAPGEEVRQALEVLDKGPARGDLLGRLSSRNANLGKPEMREKATAAVNRYMLAKREGAFAARVRAAGAVPPAVLEAVLAEQKAEGLTWTLADRLVKTGKLSSVRSAVLQKEAVTELKKQEDELVKKHRSSRFAETVAPGASISGRRTSEFVTLESSGEINIFGTMPGGGPAPPPSAAGGDEGERTVKLSPQVASGLQPITGEAATAGTVVFGAGSAAAAAGNGDEDDGKTMKMEAPPPGIARAKPTPAPKAGGPLAIGSTLAGKYEIVAELGRGGMGVVYRARSKEKGTDVALKAVSAAKAVGPAADALARFKREILTATLVTSENVCEVYDAGQAEGLAYMAMELIEGETLGDLVKREAPLAVDRALGLFGQVVKGVAACHAVNVIHRDLKPDNVRVTRDGVAKLVDFGIARLIAKDTVINEQVFVTMKGTLSGTPAYVAPELVMEPDLVDARCDLYALGVILYELLTGKLPYVQKSTVRETLRDALEGRPIPLEEAAPNNPVPEPVVRFLFKLLEKDQFVRWQSADEVTAALAEVTGPAKPAKPAADAAAKKKGCLFGLFSRG